MIQDIILIIFTKVEVIVGVLVLNFNLYIKVSHLEEGVIVLTTAL